jgi:hypothetical protein
MDDSKFVSSKISLLLLFLNTREAFYTIENRMLPDEYIKKKLFWLLAYQVIRHSQAHLQLYNFGLGQ